MPPVSEKQRRAMEAAAHGRSTLGIPKSVGEEFVAKDDRWITTEEGHHVKLSDSGTIKSGFGGKFDGRKLSSTNKNDGGAVSGSEAHSAAKFSGTDQQKESLLNYSGAMYQSVNEALRSGKRIPKEDRDDVRNMDEAFEGASTSKPMTVYRGLGGSVVSRLKIGATFTDPGFVSTTSDKNIADNFARGNDEAILEIRVPKGSRAISVADLSQFGQHEKEIVLDRGAKFRVKDIVAGVRGKPKTIIVEYEG